MNRRIALKNLALVAAGLLVLPGCETGGWNEAALRQGEPLLSASHQDLLAEIVETLIPATDTPGARELKVHAYLEKMVADCFEPEAQQLLVKGLNGINKQAGSAHGHSYIDCDANQRAAMLLRLEQSDKEEQKQFYRLVKELTIQGYMTSEYVMKNISKYEMVPGRYLGCVPVSANTLS